MRAKAKGGELPAHNGVGEPETAATGVLATPALRRPLRIFPFDPMLDRFGRSVVADIPYERVRPGPSGRLVEVIDYDPVRDCYYEPIDLDDPGVLLNQGLDLSEADPRFHQQMVYAVVSRVLEAFERGLGRPFRWRGRRRLRVFPHAFSGQNAYFDDQLFALFFGYFSADAEDPGANLPGQTVFTCLSHDIVAHETSHAVVHRLRPHYSNPTNPDVLGFHEGFADIVAIVQHFTYPDVVADHIAQTRANLTDPTPLLSLASQFGFASGTGAALRTALLEPNKRAYLNTSEEHDRGILLVAAVIDGFLRSYEKGIAPLVRIATAGSGVLQPGALHPDLVNRVAATASWTAHRILEICVRAFDYLPPVDPTFGDYLRALVTADFEVFPEDATQLRANLIEGFRARGIYPSGVISLSEGSLRIEPVDPSHFQTLPNVRERLLDAARQFDWRRRSQVRPIREEADEGPNDGSGDDDLAEWATPDAAREWAAKLHDWAERHRGPLGLHPSATIAVNGFHTGQRVDADGYLRSHISVQFVQRYRDPSEELGGIIPMGGATVIADSEGSIRYVIGKKLPAEGTPELDQLRGFVADTEHRLRSVAWSGDFGQRLVRTLNLRSLDVRR